MTAKENREFALGMLHELIYPTPPKDAETTLRDMAPYVTREFAASNIEKLASLGRTDRWQDAIKNWAAACRNTEYDFGWAYFQFSVWAGYAI